MKLYKKKHHYTTNDGRQAWNWNFFVEVGDQRIAVNVVRFGEQDKGLAVRKALLANAAEEIVDTEPVVPIKA